MHSESTTAAAYGNLQILGKSVQTWDLSNCQDLTRVNHHPAIIRAEKITLAMVPHLPE